jgi:hypothetical protein
LIDEWGYHRQPFSKKCDSGTVDWILLARLRRALHTRQGLLRRPKGERARCQSYIRLSAKERLWMAGTRGVVLHDHSLSVSFFGESRTLTLFATDHGKRLVRLPCNNEKDRRQAKLSGFDSLVIGISTAGSRSADHATPHVLRQIIAALEAISFLPGEELPQMQARLHLAQLRDDGLELEAW